MIHANSHGDPQPWPGGDGAAPVVIGGAGGSGTRLIAEILLQLNYYLGCDFNYKANDNTWFTILFRRPRWRDTADDPALFDHLRLFDLAIKGKLRPHPAALAKVARAAGPMIIYGSNHLREGRRLWPVKRAVRMFVQRPPRAAFRGWGWKEPNTHVYLEQLVAFYPRMRYIHVVRHGLDMSFGNNMGQLYNWGPRFGVRMPAGPEDEPRAALDFWVACNRRAVELGRARLGSRFLLLNFDRLCLEPTEQILVLLDFLGIGASEADVDALAALPAAPKSMGRYRNQDLSVFSEQQIEAVRSFDFEVDLGSQPAEVVSA